MIPNLTRTKQSPGIAYFVWKREKKYKRDMNAVVMTFHPALPGVKKIVDSLWSILQASDGTTKIFNENPKIVYRNLEI